MGGIFSSPQIASPAPPPAPPEPEDAEREERLKNMERRRRGRQGTVQTSWRGLEENAAVPTQGKQLLGD